MPAARNPVTGTNPVHSGQMTPFGIYYLATQCPGWKGKAPLMVAIALAESGGDNNAENYCCVGLWQVNVLAHTQYTRAEMRDPIKNLQAACNIYGKQGLSAWESYTNGAYKKHTDEVNKILKNAGVNEQVSEVGIFPESTVKSAEKAVSGALSWTKQLGEILGFLTSASGWVRIGKVLLGFILVILAVNQLSKISGGPDAVGAAKSAAEASAR